jgi:hypothetical protein
MKNNNKDLRLMFVIAAVFAASMLAISVVAEALDLFDDAEARKKGKKSKKGHADFTLPEVPILVPISLPSPTILNQLV